MTRKTKMTPDQFRKALERQGLSQAKLARLCHTSIYTVSRWACGVHPVPGGVRVFLRLREQVGRIIGRIDIENIQEEG